MYRLQALARFHVDGQLTEPGMLLETDGLQLAECLSRQGRARPLDQATADAIELFQLLRRAIHSDT